MLGVLVCAPTCVSAQVHNLVASVTPAPDETTDYVRPMAGFYLDVVVDALANNLAAGVCSVLAVGTPWARARRACARPFDSAHPLHTAQPPFPTLPLVLRVAAVHLDNHPRLTPPPHLPAIPLMLLLCVAPLQEARTRGLCSVCRLAPRTRPPRGCTQATRPTVCWWGCSCCPGLDAPS
jgi:hypothetical protein